MANLEERVSRLEETVSQLKEVPSDIFEDSVSNSKESIESDSSPEAETCEVEKSDGEVCGREKPCPYHEEE